MRFSANFRSNVRRKVEFLHARPCNSFGFFIKIYAPFIQSYLFLRFHVSFISNYSAITYTTLSLPLGHDEMIALSSLMRFILAH